ncbi:MAG: 1,4-dihydroxy-2-naphthoate polyprenyltransferase [bacterium]|nr:1,4-dihydroxy-2-naphthoate polyprenyltransferase [bacterium]
MDSDRTTAPESLPVSVCVQLRPAKKPGSLQAWILASRPPTLGAAVAPVVVGAACAHALGGLRPGPTLAALIGAIWIQIGTNFANDVFDFEKGADTDTRLGPTRAVQAGLLSPVQMRWGMVAAFALAGLCGIYLTWIAGWPVVAIGLASIAAGIAYTAGPFPLGYHGLGDLFVLIFFGFVAVCGTVFVNLGAVPELAWWAAVPPGTLATAILVVNNIRDRSTDAEAGKRTLAVRLGRRGAVGEYLALVIVAYAVPVVLMLRGILGPWGLLPFLTAPLAVVASRRLIAGRGTALNPVLVSTARLLLIFGGVFAAALVLGGGPRAV